MFHEAARSKDNPGFHDRRMDRGERITFLKYLIKFCSKCEQYSRKTFSNWKVLALTQKER